MKSFIFAFSFLFSVSAFAETIILQPGESGYFGSTKIVCSGQQQPVEDNSPVCKLMGPGVYDRNTWGFRYGIDSQILGATDNFDTTLESIDKLRAAGLCGQKPAGVCKLAGAGLHNGNSWRNRVSIDELIVAATDNSTVAIEMVTKLRKSGLCK